ncbi:hypoxanthine-guanine phosphoribosyltransferase [Chitinimonas viridis]|uniref:Hypoxanthine-guanine phosphoribosyltransferase n=2 Tax=Chitinimonas TaxID=240411 RepID=A0ABT8B531_9NEIS|nr:MULTISPECIES: hypoxanthine-guanine phosphoribosyltransferase [Chitinimonas]MDN3577373.1 hypoxanthine-guanine phosphoribosyltransferase [Chitinimonas viridis]GLR13215.1 hypoxanthine-guanine phosphoribosyltransferase [Chitinimonas prasina]
MNMKDEIVKVMAEADCLHSDAEVSAALDRMAADVTEVLKHANPLVYVVLNGGIIAAGQLLPRLRFPLEVSYLHATRYGDKTQGGRLNWKVKPTEDMHGRTVLIVDDILDEGNTLAAIIEYCREQGATEVLTAVVVNKSHDRKAFPGMHADFVGLEVEDRFLFGCGMDYKGFWRNTLGIYAVKGL